MTIEFKKEGFTYKYLDPAQDFNERAIYSEVRTDPLTKEACNVLVTPFRYRVPVKPDFEAMIRKSLSVTCPFCPQSIEKVTPKFTPDFFAKGRMRLGEACIFPNAGPYTPYTGIVVLSDKHFIDLPDLSEETVANGLLAAQTYLRRVAEYDPAAKYYSLTWHYLPASGGSQLHPHMQALAGSSPTKYHSQVLEASQGYWENNSSNFWADLIATEKELGERHIAAVGDIAWLSCFVGRGLFPNVMAIFQEKDSLLNLSEADIADFVKGLKNVLAYLNDQNIPSFNLSIYSGIVGEDYLWTYAKIIPRFTFPPVDASDMTAWQIMYDQPYTIIPPEDACKELREYFA